MKQIEEIREIEKMNINETIKRNDCRITRTKKGYNVCREKFDENGDIYLEPLGFYPTPELAHDTVNRKKWEKNVFAKTAREWEKEEVELVSNEVDHFLGATYVVYVGIAIALLTYVASIM
jgi:hypothetical protein